MTRIVAVSDLHGNLPKIPPCDLLLIAGDVCPVRNHSCDFQESWLATNFKYWLRDIDAKGKFFCCGNHDFFFEKRPQQVQKLVENYPAKYLQDSEAEFEGIRIYGTPWQPFFYDWAFNLYEHDLKKKWDLIPEGIDILIVHGPPHGYGDYAPRIIKDENGKELPDGEHTGSTSLLERIKLVKPKLVVFGHIHEAFGQWKLDDTILANVAILDGKYNMTREPTVFDIEF